MSKFCDKIFTANRVFSRIKYTERQKSCTTSHFLFYWFKTDYLFFLYYLDDVPVSKDYNCHIFECLRMPGKPKVQFW